ncbi:TPM domain-containing protein [Hymenobacter edaphi]|uniref:TPM domain-containing protein n=1 Tax=Hymenobacter edaphi TaxID=2211146 RepID=A0A328BAE2_9BACT|nr:TPM domain-containing protein [Hymenobacter edaphi]RAK62674.1 hypothetical protein DLM85_22665 [Hymenobacter edaphi]
MYRFLLLLFLGLAAAWAPPASAAPADELPPRPVPFRFVTDQAQLLQPADAQKLESGLRRYADNTGTQVVVVTVPTLGGREVADYARALGTAWGLGQRDKDNGVVVLLAGQERQVSIQAGNGLRQQLPPELIKRIINEQMTPGFKQGNYFLGLRTGLNTLMLAANPDSDPRKNQPAAPGAAPADAASADAAGTDLGAAAPGLDEPAAAPADVPFSPTEPAATPSSSPGSGAGFSLGAMALGALVLGGGVWLLLRLFRRRAAASAGYGTNPPAGYGPGGSYDSNAPVGPAGPAGGYGRGPAGQPAPDFYPNRGGGGFGGSTGSGLGGALLTGAAAAAGAYIGNRMATGSEAGHHDSLGADVPATPPLPTGSGAASGGFPLLDHSGSDQAGPGDNAPDYFADDAADSSPDYFSPGSGSYDDSSSGDTGGGGFDDTNDNNGSW